MVITKEVRIMLQKVIQAGNSAAVIIPKSVLEEMGLIVGDRIEVRTTRKPLKVEILPKKKAILSKSSGITKSFARSVDQFIQKYRPALEELAKR